MGQTTFLMKDFMKMGTSLKKGIFCTTCGFLNNVKKNIQSKYHCNKCEKVLKIQYREILRKSDEAKSQHVKDYKVINITDNYVHNEQIITIERIRKTSDENEEEVKQIKNRKRNLSSGRDILNDSFEKAMIERDLCDVPLTCDEKQNRDQKMIISSCSLIFDFESMSNQIYQNLLEELLDEMRDKIFEEIYDTTCEEISKEIFNLVILDQFNNVAGEVVENIVKSSHDVYETISDEVLYEIWNEIYKEVNLEKLNFFEENYVYFDQEVEHIVEIKCEKVGPRYETDFKDDVEDFMIHFECDYCMKTFLNQSNQMKHIEYVHRIWGNLEISSDFDEEFYDLVTEPAIIALLKENGIVNNSLNLQDDKVSNLQLEIGVELFRTEDSTNLGKLTDNFVKESTISDIENRFKNQIKRVNEIYEKKNLDKKNFYSCEECTKILRYISDMRQHVKAVHKITLITCDICKKPLKNNVEVKKHMNTIHKRYFFNYILFGVNFRVKRNRKIFEKRNEKIYEKRRKKRKKSIRVEERRERKRSKKKIKKDF